ncbi:MAG: sugar ABC transporter substrate-binding protein [Lachnospiraceae bacterium]|nr:sugar ABC transporter substrate-binding protein [Lachnospiraceae bacterium]
MKRELFKKTLTVGCVLGLAGMLAGCGSSAETASAASSSTETESASDSVTITFQQWWEPELPEGALQEICNRFTAESGINVELVSSAYADAQNEIWSTAAQGHMADVVGLDGSWVYDFAALYSIENLTDLMNEYGMDDSQLTNQVQVDGQTYMIPVVNFSYPLYVNTDILAEAGVEKIPETWSEFMDALQKIQDNTDAAGYALPLHEDNTLGIQHQTVAWLWAAGGSFLTEGKVDLEGNSVLTELITMFDTMDDNGYLAEGMSELTESEMIRQFENGELAFMVDSAAHLNTIKEANPELNFTYAAIPAMDGYTGERGADVANWGIGVGSNSHYKEESIAFIEYLMSPEVNAELAALANAFPGNAEAEPDYSENDELFRIAYEIFEAQVPVNEFTGLPYADKMMKQFRNDLIGLYEGSYSDASQMLAKLQSQWEKEV